MCTPSAPKVDPNAQAQATRPLRVLLSRQSLDDLLINPSSGPTGPSRGGNGGAGGYAGGGMVSPTDYFSPGGPVDPGLRIVR
jgi:hypothetical protein